MVLVLVCNAFVCQAVEAMGHQVLVVAEQSSWDQDTLLRKMFASLKMRFASEHDVLGIRASGEGAKEDLYMAVEEPEAYGRRFAHTMRKRKYSPSQKVPPLHSSACTVIHWCSVACCASGIKELSLWKLQVYRRTMRPNHASFWMYVTTK